MRQLFIYALLGFLGASCAKKDEESQKKDEGTEADAPIAAGTLAISTIDELPDVLSPVLDFDAAGTSSATSEAQEAASFNTLAISTSLTTLAKTGASLGRKVADLNAAFEAAPNASKAMCEITNHTMKFISTASSSGLLNCIIKGSGLAADDSIYDGTDKLFKFQIPMGGQTFVNLVKLKVTKSGDAISRFTFASCSEGGGSSLNKAGTFVQEQFFDQVIADGKMTIAAKQSGNGSKQTLSLSANVEADGTLRGLKTIEYRDTNPSNDRFVHNKIVQSSSNVLINGYSTDYDGTQYRGFYELLDKNVDGEPYVS